MDGGRHEPAPADLAAAGLRAAAVDVAVPLQRGWPAGDRRGRISTASPVEGEPGPAPADAPPNMPKYHAQGNWDSGTNAPSGNFVYDFDFYRYFVRDGWREVLAHDADGRVRSGSVDALVEAFSRGHEVKVGVRGLCSDLAESPSAAVEHEVFVRIGSSYYYTQQALFMAGSHPVVRVKPGVPLLYETRGWDFGWLMVRTDGRVVYRRCDPYTLEFQDRSARHPIRWFVDA